MEAALHSFYGNRKTLKEKGVDEGFIKGFDDKIELILNKPDGRQGKSWKRAKGELEVINQDLESILEAENDESEEEALISFYKDFQKLKEEGVDDSILKKYEEKLDGILETEKLNKNKRLVDSGELEVINQDLESVLEAENDESEEEALISFYKDRYKLKEEGVDESILKKYEEKLDGILETEKLNKNKRLADSDQFDESDMLEEAERGSMEEYTDIKMDMEKLMEAKRTHDDKGVEAALALLYKDANTLKEKGVLDDSDLKEMEEVVHKVGGTQFI